MKFCWPTKTSFELFWTFMLMKVSSRCSHRFIRLPMGSISFYEKYLRISVGSSSINLSITTWILSSIDTSNIWVFLSPWNTFTLSYILVMIFLLCIWPSPGNVKNLTWTMLLEMRFMTLLCSHVSSSILFWISSLILSASSCDDTWSGAVAKLIWKPCSSSASLFSGCSFCTLSIWSFCYSLTAFLGNWLRSIDAYP